MSFNKEGAVGIFVLIGLLCVAYLTVKLGRMEVFQSGGYELSARFTSINGLRKGADIEVAGVKVGRVSGIRLDPAHGLAVVTLRLDDTLIVADDAIASIKTSGLIGDKYINLDPGGSDIKLKSGETISDTQSAVDLEELISKYVFGKVKNVQFG